MHAHLFLVGSAWIIIVSALILLILSSISREQKSAVEQNTSCQFDFILVALFFCACALFLLVGGLVLDFVFCLGYTSASCVAAILFYVFTVVILVGAHLYAFVKGSGQSLSSSYNHVIDSMNLVSFNSRFFLQAIRVTIIYMTLLLFNLLFMELVFALNYVAMGDSFSFSLHLVFEVAHTMFLCLMQITVFVFVVIWLFQFLLFSFNFFFKD